MSATIIRGDARHLPLSDASVDAVVTDPPYEIAFMGRTWDSAGVAFDPATWAECLRVLKPGGFLLAFGGTRTWHRLVCAIEDAGFEIRDGVADITGQHAPGLVWTYGQGFPKSHNLGGDRKGWGTALKPAWEPISVARKPLIGTVAANVLTHGTGALNIDACRTVAGQDYRDKCASVVGLDSNRNGDAYGEWTGTRTDSAHAAGRWPANVVLTHSAACDIRDEGNGEIWLEGPCAPDCPVAEMDQQSGNRPSGGRAWNDGDKDTEAWRRAEGRTDIPTRSAYQRAGDSGGASRFFPVFRYEAKAPASERPQVAPNKALRLRADLTEEERAYLMAELAKAGIDVA